MGRTESFPPFTPTSGALIRHCAEQWGDAPFVVLGDERLTYSEADTRSAALAKGLLASGVGKSTPVGLLAPNGPAWVVAWLAATRIGALVALLNTYAQTRELGRALRHGDVAHLLTVESHLGHDYLERERITQVLGWPHMGKALADHPSWRERDLSSIRSGAATALPAPSDRRPPGPRATSLGMSETLGPHTFLEDVPLPPDKEGSFGRPVPGVEHRVVDPDTLVDVPPGQVGEVWVRGYSVMLGLHKRERSETFTADGWYRTGDAGHFDADGHLFFAGRLGDVVKTSGMNVTPREVEMALEDQPEVALAIVTGIDHPDRGQDVVAAVALSPGASLVAAEARERLRSELAAYKVPRHVAVFASQADLPQLDSGKVDRRRLAQILTEQFGPQQRSSP